MTVVRRIGVSGVLVSCFENRSADRVDYGPVLARGDMPDKLRPDPVAPAFSDDSDDVSPLAGGVLNSVGRTLSQGICYLLITALTIFGGG